MNRNRILKYLSTTFITYFLLIGSLTGAYAQKVNISEMVDSLHYIKGDTLDCNADIYWRIIAQGDKAIPFLIQKLDDTTNTNIHFICKNGTLNVAEIAYKALDEIVILPMAVIVPHIQFDHFDGDGCWSFYKYFYINNNKAAFKKNMNEWYSPNRFRIKKISKVNMTDCRLKYKIFNYYKAR